MRHQTTERDRSGAIPVLSVSARTMLAISVVLIFFVGFSGLLPYAGRAVPAHEAAVYALVAPTVQQPQTIRADFSGPLAQAAAGPLGGLRDWIAASYERAPALVLGLAALLAVPPLALIGLMVRKRDTSGADVTYLKTRLKTRKRGGEEPSRGRMSEPEPAWPSEAWVELEGADGRSQRHGIGRALMRIGRENDNDICLSDMTVHRYHAAIHRTEEAEFVVTDLSSAGGNGVIVNGHPVAEAYLADGDTIELGHVRLKFSARPT